MTLPETAPSAAESTPPSSSKTRVLKAQPNTVVWALPKWKFGKIAEFRLLLMGYIRQSGNRGSSIEVLVEPSDPTPTVKGSIEELRAKVKEIEPEIIDVLDGNVGDTMARVRTFVKIHLRDPKKTK